MQRGVVEFFTWKRGFGFIRLFTGEKVFFGFDDVVTDNRQQVRQQLYEIVCGNHSHAAIEHFVTCELSGEPDAERGILRRAHTIALTITDTRRPAKQLFQARRVRRHHNKRKQLRAQAQL